MYKTPIVRRFIVLVTNMVYDLPRNFPLSYLGSKKFPENVHNMGLAEEK